MRPKTEAERQLVQLANYLPPIDREIIDWGHEHLFKPLAYYHRLRGRKQEMWCQCCGHHEPCEPMDALIEEWECPKCGKTCKVEAWKKNGAATMSTYMSVVTTYKGIQVVRTVELFRDNAGKEATEYGFLERYQNWITEKGREIITSRPYHRASWYMHWEIGPYEIKKHNARCSGYYYYDDLFAVEMNHIYPRVEIAGYVRQKGIGKVLLRQLSKSKGSYVGAITRWMNEPYYETLYKQDRTLFWYFITREDRKLEKYKDSVRIARRHGWQFGKTEQLTFWLDYVDELRQLGMDTRSPRYLCPADLAEAHRQTTAKIERIKNRQELEKEIEKIQKAEPEYAKRIKPYLALCFASEDIEIRVIPSVLDVWKEGKKMHHCIYRMGYYARKDTLLLSARSASTGRRLESIELNLTHYKVMQSRGLQNKATEQHDKILQLMAGNMNTIRTINTRKQAI